MSEDKTYPQMRREFQEVFFNKLSPALKQFEGERKLKLVLACILSGLLSVFALFLLIFGVLWAPDTNDKAETLKSVVFVFALAWGVWYCIKKNFEGKIKKKIMGSVCKCFGNIEWSECLYQGREIFTIAHLIPSYTSSDYDDIFYGKYKDVNYEIIEAEFMRRSGKYSTTVFNGVIVKLDMNKSFKGNTVIYPNSLMHSSPATGLVHTELEDTVFEKKYDVFTDDEVEARYLITPSFMERLNKMKIAFSADKVSCAFWDKYLLVALHTRKDLFSLCSLLKPVNDGKQFFTMFEEILSIIKLIDYFKLDEKIGL